LFFISTLFIKKYTSAKEKAIILVSQIGETDIKLIPNSLNEYIESISSSATLLGDLLDYISKFNIAIEMIEKISSRIKPEDFLEIYNYVQQQITNTFKDNSPLELRAMIAATFAFVFIKKVMYAHYIIALNTIKEAINKQEINKQEINEQEINEKLKSEKLINIEDIEIACNTLLLLPHLNYNEGRLTYQEYIKEIFLRPITEIQPQWSFSNIIKNVEDNIKAAASEENPSKRARKKGGMKTRNNRKLMKKHRTRKRKDKK